MSNDVATTAVDAWEQLKKVGGFDLKDRDRGFEDNLREKLDAGAPSLNAALQACSTDDLVRALFDLASPHIEMFSAILKFFQRACVTQGRQQWEVIIQDEHLDLRHFEQLQSAWETLDFEYEVPSLDARGSRLILYTAHNIPELCERNLFNPDLMTQDADVNNWLEDYKSGQCSELPKSMRPENLQGPLRDAAAVVAAWIQTIQARWNGDLDLMLEEVRARSCRHDESDSFDFWTVAKEETDYCLRLSVASLACVLEATPSVRETYESRLSEAFSKYGRKRIGIQSTIEELKRILSLPVWQRRYELYAVWIATELVNALPEHRVELHHVDGKITFSFGGCVVATVHSTRPKVRLHAERRLHREGDSGELLDGSQPDYSFWRGVGDDEECGLVVEVKHYKKNAPNKFAEVLGRYARTHSFADIVLVSHGPTTDYERLDDRKLAERCHTLGEVTVSRLDQREKLQDYVQEFVGNPTLPEAEALFRIDALVLDVSGSMEKPLKAAQLAEVLSDYASSTPVILVDTEVREATTVGQAERVLSSFRFSGSTALSDAVQATQNQYRKLLVVTDEEGARELIDIGGVVLSNERWKSVDIRLVRYGY